MRVKEAKIPIFEVGFRFISKFGSIQCSGSVLGIKENEKRLCVFCDGDEYDCTIDSLEKDLWINARIASIIDAFSSCKSVEE